MLMSADMCWVSTASPSLSKRVPGPPNYFPDAGSRDALAGTGDAFGSEGDGVTEAGDALGTELGPPWCTCGIGNAIPAARATTRPRTIKTTNSAIRPSSSHSTRRATLNHAGAAGAPSGCQPQIGQRPSVYRGSKLQRSSSQ